MKVILLLIGKTDDNYLEQGILTYTKRIAKYIPFAMVVIPDIRNTKNLTREQQKEKEGEQILKKFAPGDFIVLLDESGKEFSSVEFAQWLNSIFIGGYKRMIFVVGGPYGFSPEVYKQAQTTLSLSRMTFSHQLIRLVFTEQFYRAQTILHGEPYHHE